MRVGVISDTHNLLRAQALSLLQGCEHILHAGDIGAPEILERLRAIAPLTVVRGNNDTEPWARQLPELCRIELGGVGVLMIHDLSQLSSANIDDQVRVVVSGHSHRPSVRHEGGVCYLNPGSAGPRRFKLPISLAELRLAPLRVTARLLALTP